MERQYVAVDLHAQRSLIVREDEAGDGLGVTQIDNDPLSLAAALADAGPNPEVAIEATYGWYWAVDTLQELGATVRLVNPSGLGDLWNDRRVKHDYLDCRELIDRMRLHKLPGAWIAPLGLRELGDPDHFACRASGTRHLRSVPQLALVSGVPQPVNQENAPLPSLATCTVCSWLWPREVRTASADSTLGTVVVSPSLV